VLAGEWPGSLHLPQFLVRLDRVRVQWPAQELEQVRGGSHVARGAVQAAVEVHRGPATTATAAVAAVATAAAAAVAAAACVVGIGIAAERF
jgi:hypothetical protein